MVLRLRSENGSLVLHISSKKGAVPTILGGFVALVMMVASVGKLVDLPAFLQSFDSWTLVPEALVPILAVFVPLCEAALAILWAQPRFRARAQVGMLCLLLLFTAVYAAHWIFAQPPACNCLGKIAAYQSSVSDARMVVLRNGILMLMLAFAITQSRPRTEFVTSGVPVRVRGFTLIETLVVIAVIATLIAISLPALYGAKVRSRLSLSLSNLRSHASTMTMYGGDHQDYLPAPTRPLPEPTTITSRSISRSYEAQYFEATYFWPLAMCDEYYPGSLTAKAFLSPFNEQYRELQGSQMIQTSYFLACSFFADPAFYDPERREYFPSQLRATKAHEVSFPTDKALLAERERTESGPSPGKYVLASFCDGHAADQSLGEASDQYHEGTADYIIHYSGHGPVGGSPIQHPVFGLRGRDFR